MERKLRDTINISGHQSHDLRFAREFILFLIFVLALSIGIFRLCIVFLHGRWGTRRGHHILPY
jgi:hypothetical protein